MKSTIRRNALPLLSPYDRHTNASPRASTRGSVKAKTPRSGQHVVSLREDCSWGWILTPCRSMG
ncbi:MAG: hypothetical protein PHU06_13580 [Gallionella sp.]|nr:hypothetical protein [Gallionella sp.]MDD4959937.1 hypothetical protein [Gallionella sp.]